MTVLPSFNTADKNIMPTDAEQLLIAKYQKNLPEKINDLKELVKAKNLDNTQLQLHKLAGSAGMYGFESVSSLAAKLEAIIVSGQSLESTDFQTLFETLCAKVNQN